MRRILHSFITISALSIFFIACQSQSEPVSAKPPLPLLPTDYGSIKLNYLDTSSPAFKQMVFRLDSFYRTQVAGGFNGSVLIGYNGRVLYERYFGIANRETGQKLLPSSGVQLASTTKTFTATAVLYLYQHKYLDIDEPVTTYLPAFPYAKVTLRMLLNHRSGLPDYLKWVGRYRKDNSTPIYNEDVLQMMAQYKPGLEFTPDTRFKYSNSNYVVLASIIEEVTEMRYKDFMKRYIFEPLGMKNTFVFDPADGLPAGTTISYKANWVREPVMFADGVYGDKGIYSTVQDMYRWDQSFYQHKLLNENITDLAYGPCSFERPGIKNYGLGWRMNCYPDGYKLIFHNGWWHGNNTVFYRYVQDNFTIIVLGNKYNSRIYHQPKAIYPIVKNTSPPGTGVAEEGDD